MATQIGPMQLQGKLGNVIFIKGKNGKNHARMLPPSKEVSNEVIKENNNEFAQAAIGGKLIRIAFAEIIKGMQESLLTQRLSQVLSAIVKTDTLNPRGARKISDGDIEILQGFEMNSDVALSTAFKAPYSAEIDRAAGILKVDIPSFIPGKLLVYPEGATHYKFTIAGAMVDFATRDRLTAQESSVELPLSNVAGDALSLQVQLPPALTVPLMLALGLSFFKEVNGSYTALGAGLHTAISLVAVSNPE